MSSDPVERYEHVMCTHVDDQFAERLRNCGAKIVGAAR
jgi:hypothetical protein